MIASTRATSPGGAPRIARATAGISAISTRARSGRSAAACSKPSRFPGHQIPFRSREMPMSYGWGTGGIQVTSSIIGLDDTLKVIDQGADDTTNAVNIRAVLPQDVRHPHHDPHGRSDDRPDAPPDPGNAAARRANPRLSSADARTAARLEPSEAKTKQDARARGVRSACILRLYEDIATYGRIATAYDYPVLVHGRYVMSPEPDPALRQSQASTRNPGTAALRCRAGKAAVCRAAVHPGRKLCRSTIIRSSAKRGSGLASFVLRANSYLDEVVVGDRGERIWICSDTDFCAEDRSQA